MGKRGPKKQFTDDELRVKRQVRGRARYWANLEKNREKNKRYYAENRERELARCKAYQTENRDTYRAQARAAYRRDYEYNIARGKARNVSPEGQAYRKKWLADNAERAKAAQARWARENVERMRRKVADRRAMKHRAMPMWVTAEDLQPFYDEAVRLSRETGVPHEVDHIIPLKHPLVCGLHVPANLRVVPRTANRAKGNRLVGALNEHFWSYDWEDDKGSATCTRVRKQG